MSQYSVPNKNTGDVWTADEHNQLSAAHNDTDNKSNEALGASAANTVNITANTTASATNATDVANNSVDLANLNVSQGAQDTAIAANTSGRAAQDTAIAANTAGQVTQDAAIAANTAGQVTQDAAIAANTAAVTTEGARALAAEGVLSDADIASGALVGTDLVITLKGGATVSIDATAIIADLRVASGVYNATTQAIDFTLTDSSVISVPVAALLPVITDATLDGDGATNPLSIALSSDDGQAAILGLDGKLYVPVSPIVTGATGKYRVGEEHRPAEPIDITSAPIVTGHDLTTPGAKLVISFSDVDGRPWPLAEIDLAGVETTGPLANEFFVWNHSGAFITGVITDYATGTIAFADNTRQAEYVASELVITAPNANPLFLVRDDVAVTTTGTFSVYGITDDRITGSEGDIVYLEYGDFNRDSFVFLPNTSGESIARSERRGFSTNDTELQVLNNTLQIRGVGTGNSGITKIWYKQHINAGVIATATPPAFWVREETYVGQSTDLVPGVIIDQLTTNATLGQTSFNNSTTQSIFRWTATKNGIISRLQAFIGLSQAAGANIAFRAINQTTGIVRTGTTLNPFQQAPNIDTFNFGPLEFSVGDVIEFNFFDSNGNSWFITHSAEGEFEWLEGSENYPSIRVSGEVSQPIDVIVRCNTDGSLLIVDRDAKTLTPTTQAAVDLLTPKPPAVQDEDTFAITSLTTGPTIEVGNWSNAVAFQRIMSDSFKVTAASSDVTPLESITVPEGTSETFYLIGQQHLTAAYTLGPAAIGMELRITNTAGVLSAVASTTVRHELTTGYLGVSYDDLTVVTSNSTISPTIEQSQVDYLLTSTSDTQNARLDVLEAGGVNIHEEISTWTSLNAPAPVKSNVDNVVSTILEDNSTTVAAGYQSGTNYLTPTTGETQIVRIRITKESSQNHYFLLRHSRSGIAGDASLRVDTAGFIASEVAGGGLPELIYQREDDRSIEYAVRFFGISGLTEWTIHPYWRDNGGTISTAGVGTIEVLDFEPNDNPAPAAVGLIDVSSILPYLPSSDPLIYIDPTDNLHEVAEYTDTVNSIFVAVDQATRVYQRFNTIPATWTLFVPLAPTQPELGLPTFFFQDEFNVINLSFQNNTGAVVNNFEIFLPNKGFATIDGVNLESGTPVTLESELQSDGTYNHLVTAPGPIATGNDRLRGTITPGGTNDDSTITYHGTN